MAGRIFKFGCHSLPTKKVPRVQEAKRKGGQGDMTIRARVSNPNDSDNLGNPDKGEFPLGINTFRTFSLLFHSLQDTRSTSLVDPTLVERWRRRWV
jgi:hypothetical protein